jgi:hypothetical protein
MVYGIKRWKNNNSNNKIRRIRFDELACNNTIFLWGRWMMPA